MFTQTVAVLLDRPVAPDALSELLPPHRTVPTEAEGGDIGYWMQGERSCVVPLGSAGTGGVAVTLFDRPWPDTMGDPKTDPGLFGAWLMKHFGWGTFPQALARAAVFSPAGDRATAAREEHRAFVRCNLAYVFGSHPDSPVFPEDRDVATELRTLAALGLRLLELPGALAWFHPVGEVLRLRDEVRADLEEQARGALRAQLWVGRRVYGSGRLAVVETVGMSALGAPGAFGARDHQAVFAPGEVPLPLVLELLARVAGDGASAEPPPPSVVGPGGTWTTSIVESPGPPPRELVRWSLGAADHAPGEPVELPEAEATRWSEHLEAHLGPCAGVFHELVSDVVHLDVLRFPPGPGRPHHVLVTQGMSALPMTVPDGCEELRFVELLVALPPGWVTEGRESEQERWHWPTRLLKNIARLPHLHETWIGPGHTVPNHDPPEPYADDTKLCGAIIAAPALLPDAALQCETAPGKVVSLHAIYPVHADEMELKLARGAQALLEKLEAREVTEVIDPARRSALARRFWIV